MPVPAVLGMLARELAGEVLSGAAAALDGMSVSAEVRLDVERFRTLPGRLKVDIIRACNRAAKPIRAAVEANAGGIARFGFLQRAIGTATRFYPGSSTFLTVIGPKMSFSRRKGTYSRGPSRGSARNHIPFFYAWLVERGTSRSRKRPFLQPAMDGAGKAYPAAVAAEIAAAIEKHLGATGGG